MISKAPSITNLSGLTLFSEFILHEGQLYSEMVAYIKHSVKVSLPALTLTGFH